LATAMADRTSSSRRFWLPLALVVALAAACSPGAAAPSDAPAATVEAPPSVASTPSDDGITAGEPHPSPTATPTPTAVPTPTPAPSPTAVPPEPEPFAMNLYKKGDYVAQYTFEWCVGASLQMALNMSTEDSRTSRADQQRLWEMARDRSSSPFGGANPRGWTAALNDLGIGPYKLVSLPSFNEAVELAAKSIRATGRSVGVVMWRGRHAWVMSGLESTADPRTFDAFDVTGIRVHDPLYPHGSSVWGKSPKPNSLVTPATLAKQFVLRDSTRVNLGVPPGFLLVLPVVNS
jgi:hypothetical protein